MSSENKATVFISYSHQDEAWKERLTSHLNVLLPKSSYELFDDRRIRAGGDWYVELKRAIDSASVVVLLISADYLSSGFIGKDEVPRLLARRESDGLRIMPLIVRPCAWKLVNWLAELQVWPKDTRALSGKSESQIDSDLTDFVEAIYGLLNRPEQALNKRSPARSDDLRVSVARLPVTGAELFGRERELELLDQYWSDPGVNVVSLIGWGGMGKSALVNHWLRRMASNDYRGAERVYGWSFYNQGTTERAVSADQFIEAALIWFGDQDPHPGSPWEKGERLAQLACAHRTLLVLDGLEPLQIASGHDAGMLKDEALLALLRELVANNKGLCVLTTRSPMPDLAGLEDNTVRRIDLEALSDKAGAQVLRAAGVRGAEQELEHAVREYEGHALALTLLGSYIANVYHGDIRQLDQVKLFFEDARPDQATRSILTAYERFFEEGAELDLLGIIGLIDRPVDRGALQALLSPPVIPGLTERFQQVSSEEWVSLLRRLRRARLIDAPDPFLPDSLNAHPLVRLHFGERVRRIYPDSWREGHARVYEHLKQTAKEFPETIAEMSPLYAAVVHGCQAGKQQEALVEVYWQRIQRKNEFYNTHFLGAFSADLSVLANFFDLPWSRPSSQMDQEWQAFVLNVAGFNLLALGRLIDATGPTLTGLKASINRQDWTNAAIAALNAGELYQALGDLSRSISYATQSVELADQSEDFVNRVISRANLGDSLHQSGQLVEAEAAFHEAEKIQRDTQPEFPLLYSIRGFRYCDLLLTMGRFQEVQARASQMMEIAQRNQLPLDIALQYLLLGRLLSLQNQMGDKSDYTTAAEHLNRSVDGLRRAARLDYLPLGLLARADVQRATEEFERARADIAEAASVASRGSMALLQADCHLAYANLFADTGDVPRAREHLETARQMVLKMGYHRRDAELKRMEAAL